MGLTCGTRAFTILPWARGARERGPLPSGAAARWAAFGSHIEISVRHEDILGKFGHVVAGDGGSLGQDGHCSTSGHQKWNDFADLVSEIGGVALDIELGHLPSGSGGSVFEDVVDMNGQGIDQCVKLRQL